MNRRRLTLWTAMASGLLLMAGCVADRTSGSGPGAATAAAPRAQYVGAQVCLACHRGVTPTVVSRFEASRMGKVFMHNPRTPLEKQGCEACHGPGGAHVAAGGGRGKGVGPGELISFAKNDPTPVGQRNAKCLACHERRAHLFWKGSAHDQNDVACTDCHSIMQPQSRKAALARENVVAVCGECHEVKVSQIGRPAHMPIPEGKMSCTDCHNPHGSATPAMLKYDSPNETCFACHADKRGPFLWEHPPVEENCMNCHDPHGTDHQALLKQNVFRLCQECHDPSEHPSNPLAPNLRYAFNRGCVNCHSNIHGSNHPSGSHFLR